MSSANFKAEVWDQLPAEARMRIVKLAESEKKTVAEELVILLRRGANTLAPFFLPSGC